MRFALARPLVASVSKPNSLLSPLFPSWRAKFMPVENRKTQTELVELNFIRSFAIYTLHQVKSASTLEIWSQKLKMNSWILELMRIQLKKLRKRWLKKVYTWAWALTGHH